MDNDAPEQQGGASGDFVSRIETELLRTRKVLIFGDIHDRLARDVCSRLLLLADRDSDAPIDIYINSPGGHVESGDTIHDMVRFVKAPVRMIGTGWVASAGALIFVAAPRERRFCLPNTRFLIHQPSGGVAGPSSDVEIQARQMVLMRERLNLIMAKQTGQTLERIENDTRRDFWLTAREAVEYGLVGRIIENQEELDKL